MNNPKVGKRKEQSP